MNNKKSIGVLLEGGDFDTPMLDFASGLIMAAHGRLVHEKERKPTRTELSKELGMDRWRLVRLCKALEITDIF